MYNSVYAKFFCKYLLQSKNCFYICFYTSSRLNLYCSYLHQTIEAKRLNAICQLIVNILEKIFEDINSHKTPYLCSNISVGSG